MGLIQHSSVSTLYLVAVLFVPYILGKSGSCVSYSYGVPKVELDWALSFIDYFILGVFSYSVTPTCAYIVLLAAVVAVYVRGNDTPRLFTFAGNADCLPFQRQLRAIIAKNETGKLLTTEDSKSGQQ